MKSDRVSLRAARELRDKVGAFVGEVDPNVVLPSEALGLWRTFDEIARLAEGAKTLLACKVEVSDEWKRRGCRHAADHLAKEAGTSVGAAKDSLDTSKRLDSQPRTRSALTQGRLSPAQAAAVSDAAAADPDSEQRLLDLAARTNLHELREECQRTKANADPDPDETHRRIRSQRRLRTHTDSEGAWNLHARGTVDDGARFMSALEPLIDEIFNTARTNDQRESRDVYAFDALMTLAERASQPATTREDGPKKAKRPNPRFLALLHVDWEALVRGASEGEERREIVGLGPIPIRVARDLLGDSTLKLVITKGQDVATTVHLGRGPNAARRSPCCGPNPSAPTSPAAAPTPRPTTASSTTRPNTPSWTSSTRSASPATTSKPTKAGH